MNVKEYLTYLEDKIKKNEEYTYRIYKGLREKEGKTKITVQSMKCTIGSKNNTFTDCVRNEFYTVDEFLGDWVKGLCDKYGGRSFQGRFGKHQYILIEMMKDAICREYIYDFLTRNYYREIVARRRYKPSEELWGIWFGSNPLYWGLFISPVYRNGKWTNDVSEVRRAEYEYWTVGHVLKTGLVIPNDSQPQKFENLQEFIGFYKSIFFRVSRSQYEKEIMNRYFDYLNRNVNFESVPLLIPELRFEKETEKHKYRVDFTILNSYTRKMVGFEFSPQSTHMQITGIRKESKTQKDINDDLKKKWEQEMGKRNDFFKQYGISIITFTDKELKNIDGCFAIIKDYLEERGNLKVSLEEQKIRLEAIIKKSE